MDVGSYQKANTSLTAGHFYVIGAGGDDDPKHALEQAVFTNTGTVGLRVGHSLTGILSGGRYDQVAAGGSLPIEGPVDNLIVYNYDAAVAGAFTVSARTCKRNSGQDAGVLCALDNPGSTTRYQVIRPTRTAGETVLTTVPVKYQRTVTTIKGYSVTVPSGATLTVDLIDHKSRSLLSAVMNQESLTTKTLYTATVVTTTYPDLLVVQRGRDLSLSCVSSAGGDTLGDLLIEIAHTVT